MLSIPAILTANYPDVSGKRTDDAAEAEAVAKFNKLVGYVPREPSEIETQRS
jgi:hypothetical protein